MGNLCGDSSSSSGRLRQVHAAGAHAGRRAADAARRRANGHLLWWAPSVVVDLSGAMWQGPTLGGVRLALRTGELVGTFCGSSAS